MAYIKRKAPAQAAAPVAKRVATSDAKNAAGEEKVLPSTVDSDFEDDEEEEEEPQPAQRRGTKSQLQKKAQPTGSQQARLQRPETNLSQAVEQLIDPAARTPAPKPRSPTFRFIKPYPTPAQLEVDEFPVFQDGDIIIAIDADHVFQLHSSTMNRADSFFKTDAAVKVKEVCSPEDLYKQEIGRMRRYEMVEAEERCVLKRTPLTERIPPKPKAPVVAGKEVEKDAVLASVPAVAENSAPQETIANAPATPAQQALRNGTNGIQSQDTASQSIKSGPPGNQNSATKLSTSQASSTSFATAASQPASRDAQGPGLGATAGKNSNAAAPGKRIVKVKMEDGTVSEAQEGAQLWLPQAAASSNSGAANAVNLDALEHVNGIPTIGIMNEKHYISSDPAKLPPNRARSTMSMAGCEYHVVPVNIAPPPVERESATVEGTRQDEEDGEMTDTPLETESPNPCPPLTRGDFIFGFTAFFQITYNVRPPGGIISTDSISTALSQCEAILAAAKAVSGLRVVSAEIGNAMTGFGKETYTSIRKAPRRWLRFAVELRHAAIFNEAVVHVVGQWPDLVLQKDWGFVTPRTFALVERKAKELWIKMLEVNQKLFAASLVVGNHFSRERVQLKRDSTIRFDTWFIVQVWRDWYSHQLAAARLPSKLEGCTTVDNGFDTIIKMGHLFRQLDEAGETYLDKEELEQTLKFLRLPKRVHDLNRKMENRSDMSGYMTWLCWEQDLKLMKDAAKDAVQHLMVNNSMLTPQEHGIRYLTCVTVAEEERPWDRD